MGLLGEIAKARNNIDYGVNKRSASSADGCGDDLHVIVHKRLERVAAASASHDATGAPTRKLL